MDHELLLNKLFHYGIRGKANDWLRSYLTNRKQHVVVSGIQSFEEIVKCGVPQGSTLGPLLFLIYINDLHHAFSKSIIHHFADDTNLIFASKNTGTFESVMNYELKILVDWLRANRLSLNETKTELIFFHRPFKTDFAIPTLKLNKHKLNPVKSVTYLGVTIDEVLSWNKQIENICRKLSRANGILTKLRHFVSNKTCRSIYYSIFHSHLIYGILIWSFTAQYNIEKIFKLQKKCVRIITFSGFRDHTDPLFANLNFIKIHDIINFQIAKFVFEFLSNKLPPVLNNIFTMKSTIHNYPTRGTLNLYLPKTKTVKYGINSIKFSGPLNWNLLLRNNPSLNEIKTVSKLKKVLYEIFVESYSV